jgi:membrane-associated protein
MDAIQLIIDFFLHLDKHLAEILSKYGAWTYLILFLIVFAETGLVFTPFLPGDSLLFAAGALSGHEGSPLSLTVLFLLISAAAIAGDTVNYAIGHFAGKRIVESKRRIIDPKHLERTHAFFEKYGGKTIVLARFVPIVRTFAPFVAGLGAMTYGRFLFFNVAGGVVWVAICLAAGHYFGRIPVVQENFTLVILGVIFISIVPAIVEIVKHRMQRRDLTGIVHEPRS